MQGNMFCKSGRSSPVARAVVNGRSMATASQLLAKAVESATHLEEEHVPEILSLSMVRQPAKKAREAGTTTHVAEEHGSQQQALNGKEIVLRLPSCRYRHQRRGRAWSTIADSQWRANLIRTPGSLAPSNGAAKNLTWYC